MHQAFPGGYEQLQKLIDEQYIAFNQKYSKKVLSQAINYTATGLILFQDKSSKRIVDGGLMMRDLLEYDDAMALYKAVARNQFESKFGQFAGSEGAFKSFYQGLGNIDGEELNGDVMQGAYGEWGLETSNPIPMNGVVNSYTYLDRLRLPNGDKVKYERIGSISSEITDEIVDGYTIYSLGGEKLAEVFICPYVNASPRRAPKGFVLA